MLHVATKKQGFANMKKRELKKLSAKAGRMSNPKKGFGSLSKQERSEMASNAAKARWAKVREERAKKEAEYEPTSSVVQEEA